MTAFRFCRPDDVPALVEAVNRCWLPHAPDEEPWTVDGFRRGMKEIDLWPSSCMIALDEGDPVAVSVGTRREHEVLVAIVAVRPGHERRGHGRHLLDSLSHKLAVLGPPRLAIELPHDRAGLLPFFSQAGYRPEDVHSDWLHDSFAVSARLPEGLVAEVSVDELDRLGLVEAAAGTSWARQAETVRNRADTTRCLAVTAAERIPAWIGFRDRPDAVEIALAGADGGDSATRLLPGLLARAADGRPLRVPGEREGSDLAVLLDRLGFSRAAQYHRLIAEAIPA